MGANASRLLLSQLHPPTPFEIVGVDFAGPIKYRKSSRVEGKGYLVLYTCSLTRALYLEVLPNLETTTFLSSLKRFIARRGRPLKIFSDNGKTFVGAANLLKGIQKDEQVQGSLASEKIIWRFCRGLGHILRNYVTRDNGSTCLLLRACPLFSC